MNVPSQPGKDRAGDMQIGPVVKRHITEKVLVAAEQFGCVIA